jgi:acetylornithine/N-succinyldiaminopimelate aminotransferase
MTAATLLSEDREHRHRNQQGVAVAAAPDTSPDALLPVYHRQPVTFVRGAGVELFDAAGQAYLDFTSGIAVNALGYDDAELKAVMHAAVEQGIVHTSNLYRTAPGERLAALLVERSFAGKVFFCNSGAEANEGAFKFARRWARKASAQAAGAADAADAAVAKHEIIALRGAFHGRLFGTLAATDRPAYRMPFRPLAGGISIAERDLDDLDVVLSAETTAAVIVEPVQGEGGVRVLDAGWLRALRQLTRERSVALIFDEIQCGLGRTGRLFAYEHAGVEPDLLTLAKPLAGGLPMGAVLMTDEIAAAIEPGDHGSTFGGGPFVATVAVHVVERLADPALLERVREDGAWLGASLQAIAACQPSVRAVRGVGYMWCLDVAEPAAAVVGRALELGLLVCSAGPHTVRLLPPLVATRDDLTRGLALLEAAIAGGAAA